MSSRTTQPSDLCWTIKHVTKVYAHLSPRVGANAMRSSGSPLHRANPAQFLFRARLQISSRGPSSKLEVQPKIVAYTCSDWTFLDTLIFRLSHRVLRTWLNIFSTAHVNYFEHASIAGTIRTTTNWGEGVKGHVRIDWGLYLYMKAISHNHQNC